MVDFEFSQRELKKDFPDLSLMLRIIADDLVSIAGDYQLQFYKPEQKKSLMETTISGEDKTLFIASTEDINSYIYKPETNLLVAYNREFKTMAGASSEEEAVKYFKELQLSEMRRHIYSYVCAPLHLFGKVIGHIYIETDLIHRKRIFADDAMRVGILADLLSYGMTKTVIARSYFAKPIAEIMFSDFLAVCFDYIANEFPKSRYMSNGQTKCPLVVRTGNGAGSREGGGGRVTPRGRAR